MPKGLHLQMMNGAIHRFQTHHLGILGRCLASISTEPLQIKDVQKHIWIGSKCFPWKGSLFFEKPHLFVLFLKSWFFFFPWVSYSLRSWCKDLTTHPGGSDLLVAERPCIQEAEAEGINKLYGVSGACSVSPDTTHIKRLGDRSSCPALGRCSVSWLTAGLIFLISTVELRHDR